MAGYYHICPNISLSGLSGHAGILWGQKSDDFGLFCSAMYFNSSNQVELSGNSTTVYSTSSDHLFSVQSPSGVALLIKADDSTDDIARPEMTLYGDLSVTGCIYGTFADTYVSAGTFDNSTNCITLTRSDDCTVDVDISNYCHSSLAGVVADQHVAHSNVNINTSTGLCGGGNIASSRTLSLSGQAATLHNLSVNNSSLIAKDSGGTFVSISSSSFVDVTGDTITGDLIVEGDLTVQGTTVTLNTEVCTTSAMEITNLGTGPALVVNQCGNQPVVNFVDYDGVCANSVLYIEDGGNVGLGTTNPNERLSVVGNISASGIVCALNGCSTEWNQAYDNYICSIGVTGTTTKTITLTQNDGGTLTANFTDNDTIYTGWSLSASDTSGTFNIASGCTTSFCGGAGIDVCRVNNEIKVINTINNNNQLGNGCNYIKLTSLSVGPEGTPSGDGSLSYSNTTGVFTYTPPLISDETITISAGTDLSTGGSFTLNQSSGSTVTINHSNITRTDNTSTASPAHGGTFTAIDSITSNARGHITAVNTKTITLPAGGYTGWDLYTDTTCRSSIADGEQVRFCGGTDISLGYTATNNVITINHDTVSSTSSHSGCSVGYGGTFTVVCALSATTQGHTCCIGTMTITLPASDENDTTYDISASSTAGGANLNLNAGGSGSGTDSVKLASGTGITVSYTDASTITINHPTQTAITCNCSNGTVLQDISINNCGHVTSVGYCNLDNRYCQSDSDTTYDISASTSTCGANINLNAGGSGSGTDTIKLCDGNGINVCFTDANTITICHTDTSSQASVNNSNGTVIQDVTLDGFGHVTGLTSYNLDSRYYTETEIDTLLGDYCTLPYPSNYVTNDADDTMNGTLTATGCVVTTKLIDYNNINCCVDPSGTSNLKDINLTGGDLLFYPDSSGDGAQFDYYAGRLYIGNCAGTSWHMAIEDSGCVGIGTTDPKSNLHVYGSGYQYITTGSSNAGGVSLVLDGASNGDAAGGDYFYISHCADGRAVVNNLKNNSIYFNTSSTNTTRLTITSAGNVGIGTTDPGQLLHVCGRTLIDTGTNISPDFNASGQLQVCGLGYGGYIALDGTAMYLGHNSSSRDLRFDVNETTRVTINTSGNVGIGTTDPGDKLHVDGNVIVGDSDCQSIALTLCAPNTAGAPASTAIICMCGYEGRGQGVFHYDASYSGEEWFSGIRYSSGFNYWSVGYDLTGNQAEYAANAKLTVSSGGCIGIGSSQPTAPLNVVGTNNVEGPTVPSVIQIADSSDVTKNLRLGYESTWDAGSIASSDLGTGWKNTVINAHGGNVGIGLTNPSNKLHVSGAVCATGSITSGTNVGSHLISNWLVCADQGFVGGFGSFNASTDTGTPLYTTDCNNCLSFCMGHSTTQGLNFAFFKAPEDGATGYKAAIGMHNTNGGYMLFKDGIDNICTRIYAYQESQFCCGICASAVYDNGARVCTAAYPSEYTHPTQTAITCNCSNGIVLQDITVNTLGHVTAVGAYDLDNRYYTETESDNKYLLNTTDTLTGDLTVTGCIDVCSCVQGYGVSTTFNSTIVPSFVGRRGGVCTHLMGDSYCGQLAQFVMKGTTAACYNFAAIATSNSAFLYLRCEDQYGTQTTNISLNGSSGNIFATGNLSAAEIYENGSRVCTSFTLPSHSHTLSDITDAGTAAAAATTDFAAASHTHSQYCTSNDYVDGASFNTADGNLTLTRTGALADITTCLDGRYCTSDTNTTYSAGNGISLSSTTFSVAAGTGLDQTTTGLCHEDTSTLSGLQSTTNQFVKTLTVDGMGHVTAVTFDSAGGGGTDTNDYVDGASFNTATGNLVLTRTGTLGDITTCLDGRYCTSDTNTTYNDGTCISIDGSYNINHSDTSNLNGLQSSSGQFVKTLTVDDRGHVTAVSFDTASGGTGDITAVIAGAGLTGGATSGSATIDHDVASNNGTVTTCNASSGCSVTCITLDAYGHVKTIGISCSTSDYRAKTCIQSYNVGYESVKNVDTYKYVFKDDDTKEPQIGLIAHELQEGGVTFGVTGYKDQVDENGKPIYQTVDLPKLVPTLWSALKTAINKIEDLEDRLATLELQSNT